jgi:hypothetical protein
VDWEFYGACHRINFARKNCFTRKKDRSEDPSFYKIEIVTDCQVLMMAPLFSEWIRTTKYSLLLCLIWTSVAIDISINSNAAASETQHTTHTDATVPRFIQGCQDKYPMARDKCIANYEDRIQYSKLHSDLQVNYTKAGFQIIQLPDAIKTQLQHFWDKNYEITKTMEVWNIADVYSNHWESPTIMVPLDTEDAAPVVQSIKDRIGAAMEDWTGMSLQPISLYGIRIFQSGAIIPSHVDRAPFMFTAILNVAQDVDEDWNMLVCNVYTYQLIYLFIINSFSCSLYVRLHGKMVVNNRYRSNLAKLFSMNPYY